MTSLKAIALCAAALGVSGCYSFQGSERVIGRDATLTNAVPSGSIFRSDFEAAFVQRRDHRAVDPQLVQAMLSSGFTHIYSFCDNYFDVMGLQQRRSRVIRDSVAPISALITGVLALHNFESNPGKKEDLLSVLGLTTSATASTLDIYDQHMLFGAENIGSVETLTKTAVSEHSAVVLAFNQVTFDAAVRHLLDNQAICSPQHILSLTREAIREGRVVANGAGPGEGADSGDDGEANFAPSQDSNKSVGVSIRNN